MQKMYESEILKKKKAILAGIEGDNPEEAGNSLAELERLADTANIVVAGSFMKKKSERNPAYLMGKGSILGLADLAKEKGAEMLIFDEELSGAHIRNIEDLTGLAVTDRTSVILEIFAGRARSREGKLQVELASLKYRLPRLYGMGRSLSRLGGGIGTRGPGETKLETDRRHIRRRISYLEKELAEIGKRRSRIRSGRKRNDIPVIAVTGYTNAGKSTLINKLCGADIFAEDMLFATLDPTARKLTISEGRNVLLVDTVGFIRKLPHDLVEAFKSTLEEAVYADAILHVVDASSKEYEEQMKISEGILATIGAGGRPVLTVYNKIDIENFTDLSEPFRPGRIKDNLYAVSAVTGEGLESLSLALIEMISKDEVRYNVFIPYDQSGVLQVFKKNAVISDIVYLPDGIKLTGCASEKMLDKIASTKPEILITRTMPEDLAQ